MHVGLTSGCFDLIHFGHLHYLDRCRRACDKLIVGVDSDDMVRRAKGPQRPIIPELERLALINSLGVVDAAFLLRDLSDIAQIARQFAVTKLFKHAGFRALDQVVGLDSGAELVIVPDVVGLVSTSSIVARIRG
jgi:D-beta-D-heptose 7-phosphate kinase/D-beta-D-heptose 1-phosphate adenosyltransferase